MVVVAEPIAPPEIQLDEVAELLGAPPIMSSGTAGAKTRWRTGIGECARMVRSDARQG
jgi:hypothetical protein